MPRLTKRTVDAIRPGERETFVWDGELPGFGLRVLPSGRRTYFVQYRAKGRTRRFALGVHGILTPDAARRKASKVLADVLEGADPSAARREQAQAPSVAELCERYMADHAKGRKKASSVYEDQRLIDRFVCPHLGRWRVADLTRADVLRLHNALRETPVQANRVLFLLSTMFNLAERWGLRADHTNPARHVERFPEQKRERFLSPAELARLGEALEATAREGSELPSVVPALRLLVFTGARRGEILNLRWSEVDLERACLRLPDSKTGAKSIPLNVPALEVLTTLAEARGDSPWVIQGRQPGRPLVGLPHAWERIREQAKLEDVRIHDLRHSFASVGASSGQSLLVIGRLLGHTQAATTARYAHLSDDPARSASEAIGARLNAALMGRTHAVVVPLVRSA